MKRWEMRGLCDGGESQTRGGRGVERRGGGGGGGGKVQSERYRSLRIYREINADSQHPGGDEVCLRAWSCKASPAQVECRASTIDSRASKAPG